MPPLCVCTLFICARPRALLCPTRLKYAFFFRCIRPLHLCALPSSRACPPPKPYVPPSLPRRTCLPLAVYTLFFLSASLSSVHVPCLAARLPSLPIKPSCHPCAPRTLAHNAGMEIHLTFAYAMSTYNMN